MYVGRDVASLTPFMRIHDHAASLRLKEVKRAALGQV